MVLVAVETDAKAVINQVLQNSGIHVVGLRGEAFCIVMPHCGPESPVETRIAEKQAGCGDASGVDRTLLVEEVIPVATRKADDRQVELGIIEYSELLGGIEIERPLFFIKLSIECRERSKALSVARRVSHLVERQFLPTPAQA